MISRQRLFKGNGCCRIHRSAFTALHCNRTLGTMKLTLFALLAALLSMATVAHADGRQRESHTSALDESLMHISQHYHRHQVEVSNLSHTPLSWMSHSCTSLNTTTGTR